MDYCLCNLRWPQMAFKECATERISFSAGILYLFHAIFKDVEKCKLFVSHVGLRQTKFVLGVFGNYNIN